MFMYTNRSLRRAHPYIFISRLALLLTAPLLFALIVASALVFTVQTRNDLYLPLTGSNPHNDAVQVFDSDTSAFTPEAAEVLYIKAFDGTALCSLIWRKSDCHKWAIVAHGYSNDYNVMLNFGKRFYYGGYNVLMPDLRGHGKSGSDLIGMGWTDRFDIICWIDRITEYDDQAQIVLYGISMGADAVLSACGEDGLPGNVFAAISDCAFTSTSGIVSYHIKMDLGLPAFPFIDLADALSSLFIGYGWKESSALEQVKKSSVPTLFIHGRGDSFVPTAMCYELFSAASCNKALLVIEGAGHAASAAENPEVYWDSIFTFINRFDPGAA